MKSNLYEARLRTADLRAIAGAAKPVHDEVTLRLDSQGIAFWCKDDRKECALVGAMEGPEDAGEILIRVKAEQLADQVAVFDAKATVALVVRRGDDGLVLELTHEETDQYRMVSVVEAEPEDLPYATPYKVAAACNLDLKGLSKVLGSFKRNTDVMEVAIGGGMFQASYKSRKSQDIWQHACTTGEKSHGAKFSVALLKAAVNAAKAVETTAQVQLMKAGPMRIRAETSEGLRCEVYVVSSVAI